MNRYDYSDWWDRNTGPDGEPLPSLPEPVATLAAHVLALQDRIDKLTDPDTHAARRAAVAPTTTPTPSAQPT